MPRNNRDSLGVPGVPLAITLVNPFAIPLAMPGDSLSVPGCSFGNSLGDSLCDSLCDSIGDSLVITLAILLVIPLASLDVPLANLLVIPFAIASAIPFGASFGVPLGEPVCEETRRHRTRGWSFECMPKWAVNAVELAS